MRTSRRGINVAMPPKEWHSRCRVGAGNMREIPRTARLADRGWLFELEELVGEGYVPCEQPGRRRLDHVARACHTQCRCGDDMDYRGFELVGPEGELIAYRYYALCPACWWWVEL